MRGGWRCRSESGDWAFPLEPHRCPCGRDWRHCYGVRITYLDYCFRNRFCAHGFGLVDFWTASKFMDVDQELHCGHVDRDSYINRHPWTGWYARAHTLRAEVTGGLSVADAGSFTCLLSSRLRATTSCVEWVSGISSFYPRLHLPWNMVPRTLGLFSGEGMGGRPLCDGGLPFAVDVLHLHRLVGCREKRQGRCLLTESCFRCIRASILF